MADKKKNKGSGEFVLFNILYEDGSRRSNCRVPASEVGGLDGDAPARTFLEAQQQEIAERSGRSAPAIKTVTRSAAR